MRLPKATIHTPYNDSVISSTPTLSGKIPKTGFWGGEHDEKTPAEIRGQRSEL